MCLGGQYIAVGVFSRLKYCGFRAGVLSKCTQQAHETITEHWQQPKEGVWSWIHAKSEEHHESILDEGTGSFPTCHEKAASLLPRIWPTHGPLPGKEKGQGRDLRPFSIADAFHIIMYRTSHNRRQRTRLYLFSQLPEYLDKGAISELESSCTKPTGSLSD